MSQLADALTSALGPDAVLTGGAASERGAGLWAPGSAVEAEIYVRPRDTAGVSKVLSLCHAAGHRVIVHGGKTGLVHGTESGPRDLVLSLERMARIEDVDAVGQTLTAQAGVTLLAAQQEAESYGLLLPLDMGSRGSATLGGAAATNAGGNRVLRYGMTRALVLGIEGVLPDGTVISALNRMIKNNAGYDLKHLLIGSEGTLGVITRLVLRLVPRPAGRQTAFVALPDFRAMTRLLHWLASALGGSLSAYEAMWQDFYQFMTGAATGHSAPIGSEHPYYVLIEAEGSEPQRDAERFEDALTKAFGEGLVTEVVIAKSDRERDALWAIRDDVVRFQELRPVFMFDVSAPLTEMEAYVETVRRSVTTTCSGARVFTFGHIADGNLHFAISAGTREDEERAVVERAVYEPLAAIGGSVSAEHGIGLEKKAYLSLCRTEAEIELMRTLKRALDPKGILNPGRIFDVA